MNQHTGFSRRAQLALLLSAEDWPAAAALLSNSADSLRAMLTPEQAARIAAVPAPAVDRHLAAVPPRAVPGRSSPPVQSAGIVATKQRSRKKAA